MRQLNATALSVGLLGALCTWLFLTVGTIVVWAAFVAWACFFHSAGEDQPLTSTIASNAFGCFIGWLGALVIVAVPGAAVLTPQIWAGLIVFVTVVTYIQASQIPFLSSVPGITYGYACTFAYLLQTPGQFNTAMLLSPGIANPLFIVPVSMALGALFAFASARLAAALARPLPIAA
jgi:hypothetical protein